MTARRRSAPLYWRILRLRRVRPRAGVTFLLFEGSIILGLLLAMADIVNLWGALAIPVAVAVMVKLNDVVATTLDLRPLAEAQLRTPRILDGPRMGISAVPRSSRMSPLPDDADEGDANPTAPPERPDVVRGVAAVSPRRAMPHVHAPGTPERAEEAEEAAEDVAEGADTPGAGGDAPAAGGASTSSLDAIDAAHEAPVAGEDVLAADGTSAAGEEPQPTDGSRNPGNATQQRPEGPDHRGRGNTGRFKL